MRTKDTLPSSASEYSRSSERPLSAPRDALRDALLLARETGEAIIPENTFAIRDSSRNFTAQGVAELSQWIDGEREYRHQKSTTGHMDPTAWEARSLASLNGEVKLDRMDGKTTADITVLYGRNTHAEEGEVHIPSAVIAHEPLSTEEVRRIREALPDGVPIIDGATNELLDDVGRAERKIGHEVNEIYHDMGGTAFRASRYDRVL